MTDDALEWTTERILQALPDDDGLTPRALTFLLRRYAVTGRADLSEALGSALARALDRCARDLEPDHGRLRLPEEQEEVAQWLMLFVEAAGLSDDERLAPGAAALAAVLAGGWPSRGRVAPLFRGVEAYLSATRLDQAMADAQTAIDELERIVGAAYVPGDGLAGTIGDREPARGDLIDHTAAASALLTAYGIAGRLPYSMLAEELMQFARRSWWNDERGGFHASPPPSSGSTSNADCGPGNDARSTENVARSTSHGERSTENDMFAANCEAARVWCRLAALHRDQDYRHAAVIIEQSDYAGDARRALDSLGDGYRAAGSDVALYGLALTEHEALRR